MNTERNSLVLTPFAEALGLALTLVGLAAPVHSQTADDFNPGANSTVYSLAVQADGKILVGGGFNTLDGQTRTYLGQLNVNGTLDPDLQSGGEQRSVFAGGAGGCEGFGGR